MQKTYTSDWFTGMDRKGRKNVLALLHQASSANGRPTPLLELIKALEAEHYETVQQQGYL